VLEITVFGEGDVSGKFPIESDGTFNFPLIGRIKASGLTLRAIERELHDRLADGYLQNPQVTVTVGQFRSQRIFIVGEVGRPGTYPLTADMTLIEALATAGSTQGAAADHVVIIRGTRPGSEARLGGPGDEVLQVDLGKFQAGSLADNVTLRDGDVVVVPKAQSIYVLGQVGNPGAYSMEKDINVMQALAMAGGVTERGSLTRVRIYRMVKGKKVELKATVNDPVHGGDTVMVLARFF
jgi:polysaccharide export outer membrane protein